MLEPNGPIREIPTIQTDLEQLQERLTKALDKFEKIDFEKLAVSITDAANSIKTLTSTPELRAALESLKGTIANLNQAIASARSILNNAKWSLAPWSLTCEKTPTKPTRPCRTRAPRWSNSTDARSRLSAGGASQPDP